MYSVAQKSVGKWWSSADVKYIKLTTLFAILGIFFDSGNNGGNIERKWNDYNNE